MTNEIQKARQGGFNVNKLTSTIPRLKGDIKALAKKTLVICKAARDASDESKKLYEHLEKAEANIGIPLSKVNEQRKRAGIHYADFMKKAKKAIEAFSFLLKEIKKDKK